MQFELRAIGPEGKLESIALQALDEAGARQQVEGRGYTIVSVRPRSAWRLAGARSKDRFPILLFSQELLVLLDAGLSLVEAIETLVQKERRGDLRALLERVLGALRQGKPFSSALEQFPSAFPALYVATVRAAETTSALVPALQRFVAYQSQLDATKKRVVNASIYPLLLIGVGGLVSLFLLFYVVPRFGRIYEDRSAELPMFSRALLHWGQFAENHGAWSFAALAALIGAAVYLARRPAVQAMLADGLWRVPMLGEQLKLYQLARFYRTIGMLLKGGVPLVSALGTGAALLHPILRVRLARASRSISEGRSVSECLEANGLTTPVALRMLLVGERSGNMGEMMDRIASFHDEEIHRWVEWFTRLFEPILMAAIGVVIGAIVILMYMPIFELAGNLR